MKQEKGNVVVVVLIIIILLMFVFSKSDVAKYRGFFYPNGCLVCDDFIVSPNLNNAEQCVQWGENLRAARKNPNDTWECGKNCKWKDGFSVCESTFGMEGTGMHMGN